MMVYPLSWVVTGVMMLVLYRIKWQKVRNMEICKDGNL